MMIVNAALDDIVRPAPLRFTVIGGVLLLLTTACEVKQPEPAAEGPRPINSIKLSESTETEAAGDSIPHERVYTIAPNGSLEANLTVVQGDSASAEFVSVGGALHWDVHSHTEGETIIHDQGISSDRDVFVRPERSGGVSFMWRNLTPAPIQISVRIYPGAGGEISSWSP